MSLTSKIKGTSDADKAFRELLLSIEPSKEDYYTLSGKEPFSKAYELLAPPIVEQRTDAGLVGTAFDYLARLRVGQFLNKKEVLTGMTWANMYVHFVETTALTYDPAEKWLEKLNSFMQQRKTPITDLLEVAVHMAKFERVYRSGGRNTVPDIHYLTEAPPPAEVIADLTRLMEVFEETFMASGILKKKSKVIFNPNFGVVSELVGGADGDLYIDGTLYDFKTGKHNRLVKNENIQMAGYYLLGEFDSELDPTMYGFHGSHMNIKRVAFYRARYGEIEYCNIADLSPYAVMKPILSKMGKLVQDQESRLQMPPYSDKTDLRKRLKEIRNGA